MKTRKYFGHTILPCSYQSSIQAGFRWYIESLHFPSGIPWDEQNSSRFSSLRAAKEAVRESLSRYADAFSR